VNIVVKGKTGKFTDLSSAMMSGLVAVKFFLFYLFNLIVLICLFLVYFCVYVPASIHHSVVHSRFTTRFSLNPSQHRLFVLSRLPSWTTELFIGFLKLVSSFNSFHALMQSRGVRRPSVRPSVCKLCANRYFYHRSG